jgi:hypothetical protein
MILSNQKFDYSSVRRMPTVKLSGQAQGTTTNTMPTSTSLQDISSHHAQKFTWNTNNTNNDQQLVNFSEKVLSSNPGRPLIASHSDERVFEHPEVTIKPSALDDELQRRLLTIKTSNTSENLLERGNGQSVPNILEHPDMRSPVVMQQISSSASSSALLIHNDCKRISRTQSDDVYETTARTPSPGKPVEFFIDNHRNSKQSISPGSLIDTVIESPEQDKKEDLQISTDSVREYSKPSSSNSDINLLKTKKNDSW